MKVKFIDFSREYNFLKKELNEKLSGILRGGNYILGEELKKFEAEFAYYCGTKFAVGVNSGTDALFLALRCLGIREDDEVIVPAFTYLATALAVSYTQARPVFCDIEEETYGIDIEALERKITPKTKAIIVVHLYGHPVKMQEVLKIARKYQLKVIEDCAQAHGARIGYKDRRVGSFGDLGCFSFYPTKNLGCYGDGGMIVTNSESQYKNLVMLRDYGRQSKYKHKIIGYNTRLDTIQAGILRIKLKYLDNWNKKRRMLASYYSKLLQDMDEIILPQEEEGAYHVYHLYVIRVKKRRDKLYKLMLAKGIQTLIHYPIPCHLQPVYRQLKYKKGDFPVAEEVAEEVISLPLYPFLRKKEIGYVVKTIEAILL